MAEIRDTTASTRRQLPGTRWSAIRINWRWAVQAVSLTLGIYFFKLAFETSKMLLLNFSFHAMLNWSLWVLLFAICFLALMLTSYLKERGNRTLRRRIEFFEKLVKWCHLENYSEQKQN